MSSGLLHHASQGDTTRLKGSLKSRHLTMISIAGAIGGALFVGSGKVIASAGPAAVLAYLAGGILVLLVMRMLGEMSVAQPDLGSFSTYADRAIGRWAGFTIGWLYWYFWALLMGWEAYVAGKILHLWFPMIPIWGYMLLVTVSMTLVNLLKVRNFGEVEFWFALIKVIAIVLFLITGSLAVMHLLPLEHATTSGFSHLTSKGFMPNGFGAVVTALLGVMFAFMGVEIVTVAAAESENPAKEVIQATKSVVWRVILFYVGSIFIAVCLIAYDEPMLTDPTSGTFSVTLQALGVPYAYTIVNFVVLTSVCSCFNSALYTCSRMMFSLAKRGDAPKLLGTISHKTGTPWVSVFVSTFFVLVAIYLTATEKMDVYDVLMTATGTVALYVYLAIAFSQLNMRRKVASQNQPLAFKMWLFPWLTYAVIGFIIVAIMIMIFEGTYRNEVIYTTALSAVIVTMGIMAQKFGIGKSSEGS